MNNPLLTQKGFTLVETLIVLSIVLTVTFMSWTTIQYIQQKQLETHFFDTFEQDIFFLQQYSSIYQNDPKLLFYPEEHRYIIYYNPFDPPVISREFNDNISFRLSSIGSQIRFKPSGTIVNPGSLFVTIDSQEYPITFPFGKARYYVIKE
ncbi:competence type IV pilus minor pilin ComGD [Alkalibacillus salilacus]|uniref:competence type IV pilus minor pilin ComGD n=1 Tax=Alkalibacillus salilacus TaxID=284582 RepID=UPI0027D8F99B|nr:competence type IV pilus minor pilin ComGD [Alkalibacillus salilacus]